MARRRKYAPSHNRSAVFALNITSMTDMFTIMLVFLLQTYSNAEIQVVPEKGMELPLSNSEANPILAVQLSLTKEELKFEQKTLAMLSKADFKTEDIDKNDSNFIPKLFQELQKISSEEKQKESSFNAGTSNQKPNPGILDGRVILKADANLPYGLIRKVMYTSSMAGFPKLKLATVVGK